MTKHNATATAVPDLREKIALASGRRLELREKLNNAREQLRREEALAQLFLGLTEVSHADAEQFSDAPSACQRLRLQIAEIEERCKGLDLAADFLRARDLKRQLDELAPRRDAAYSALAEDFHDRDHLMRQKNRYSVYSLALRNGISVPMSQEVNIEPKILARIAEYDRCTQAVAELDGTRASLGVALGDIRQRYGDLADVVLS